MGMASGLHPEWCARRRHCRDLLSAAAATHCHTNRHVVAHTYRTAARDAGIDACAESAATLARVPAALRRLLRLRVLVLPLSDGRSWLHGAGQRRVGEPAEHRRLRVCAVDRRGSGSTRSQNRRQRRATSSGDGVSARLRDVRTDRRRGTECIPRDCGIEPVIRVPQRR